MSDPSWAVVVTLLRQRYKLTNDDRRLSTRKWIIYLPLAFGCPTSNIRACYGAVSRIEVRGGAMSQQLPSISTINVDQQAVNRATTLISKGRAVLATQRSGSNGYLTGPDYLDGGSFYGWRTQALSFLVSLLDENHVFVEGFKEHCSRHIRVMLKLV